MTDQTTKETNKDLRDARLAKALHHAPDAHVVPGPALRDTIKTIAASALKTRAAGQFNAKTSWWRTLWASTGSARGPWGGALATLVLGCIITAMWYGQDVPDQQVRYHGAAPEAAPASVAAPAPMQERVPTRARTNKPGVASEEKRAAPVVAQALADKAKDQVATEATSVRREADASSRVAGQPAGTAALIAQPSTAATLAAAPSAPNVLLKSKVASAFDWHSAAVQYQGRTTQLAATEANQLGTYVLAVVNTTTPQSLPTVLPSTAPVLRITFTGADAQSAFTLWNGAMQWQRPGQADVVGVPQADALAQLLAQLN